MYMNFDESEHWADEIERDETSKRFLSTPPVVDPYEEEAREWSGL